LTTWTSIHNMEFDTLNTETTAHNLPDPDLSGFIVPNSKIVVRPCHVEGVTDKGLILTGKTSHDIEYLMNVGKVLKLGQSAYKQEMFKETGPWCKVGDFIMLPRLEGQRFKWKGIPLIMIICDRVQAVVDDPKHIDPHFNIGV